MPRTVPRLDVPVAGVAIILVFIVHGCTSSSPRFRSEETALARARQAEDESRFAARIRADLEKEDDRKVDVKKLEERYQTQPPPSGPLEGRARDGVLVEVVSFLGAPYEYGGSSKEGIDCSGLTKTVYSRSLSIPLPRTVYEQFSTGKAVNRGDLAFGDLVFFNTTGSSPSHVGIYLEDGLFAHSSVTSGVTFSSLESTYYRKRYVGARRMVD